MDNKLRHIIADEATREFVCTRCGGSYKVSMPGPLEFFDDLRRVFVIDHKHCAPPEPDAQP